MPASARTPQSAPSLAVAHARAAWPLLFVLAPLVAAFAAGGNSSDQRSAWTWGIAAVSLVIAAVALWARGWRPAVDRATAALTGSWVAAGLWYRAAAWWGVLPGATRFEAARLLGAVAVGATAWLLARRPDRRLGRALVVLVLAASVFVSVDVIINAGWSGIDHQVRTSGWMGYWNSTALLCAWLALGVTAGLTVARRQATRTACVLVIALAGLGLAVTVSRAALAAAIIVLLVAGFARGRLADWIAVGVGVVTVAIPVLAVGANAIWLLALLVIPLAWALAPDRSSADRALARAIRPVGPWIRTSSGRGAATLAVILVAALAVILAIRGAHSFAQDTPITNQTAVARLGSASGDHRWQWWKESAREFAHHPLIGQGGEAFRVWHLAHRHDLDAVSEPHALPLQLLDDGGIVLGLLGLVALAALGRLTWQVRQRPWAALAAGMVWVAVLQSLVDWTLQFPVVLVCVAILLGVVAAEASPDDPQRIASSTAAPLRLALAVVAALALVIAIVPAAAVQLDRSSQDALAAHPRSASREAKWSFALVPQPSSFSTAVYGIEATNGQGAALSWLTTHVGVVSHEVATWAVVGERAAAWKDAPLAARSAAATQHLDPIQYASVHR